MPNSEPQEDLDRLLKEYDSTSTNGQGQGQWTNFHREPGCSRTALRRCFVFTFLCLIAVSVGWFLHVNVFLDNPLPNATTVQTSLLSGFGDSSSGSNGLMDMVTKSGILDEINMTAVIDYMMKHTPPELAAKLLSHVNDIKNGDFLKVFQDTQLMDGILDFLDVPDDFPGLGKKQKKVDDYDYEDEEVPQKTTLAHSVPTRQVSRNKFTLTTVKSIPGLSKQDNFSLTHTLKKMLFNKNKEEESDQEEEEESLDSEQVFKLKKSELEKSKLELQLQLLQEQLNREKKVNKINKESHSDNPHKILLNSGQERGYGPPVFRPNLPHEYPNQVYIPHSENYDIHNMNPAYQAFPVAQNQRYQHIPPQQLPNDQYLSQQLDVRGWHHQQQQQLPEFPFQQQLPFPQFQPVQHNQQNQQVLQQQQHNQQVLQQQHFQPQQQQQQQSEQSLDQKQQEQTQTQQPLRLSFNFGQPALQKLQQESVQQQKQQQELVQQPKQQQQSLIQQLKQESLLKQLKQPMKQLFPVEQESKQALKQQLPVQQNSQQPLKQPQPVEQDSQPAQQPLRQSQVQQLSQEQTHEEKPFSLLSPMDILQQFLQSSNPESRMQKDKLHQQLDEYVNKAAISSTDQPLQNKPAGLSSFFQWNRDLSQLAPKQVEKANLKYKDWSNVWDLTNSEQKKV